MKKWVSGGSLMTQVGKWGRRSGFRRSLRSTTENEGGKSFLPFRAAAAAAATSEERSEPEGRRSSVLFPLSSLFPDVRCIGGRLDEEEKENFQSASTSCVQKNGIICRVFNFSFSVKLCSFFFNQHQSSSTFHMLNVCWLLSKLL